MSLSKRTIPYASIDGSRNEPFDKELQLASLYILADMRRGADPLSATAFLNYPIQIRRWEGGALLIDVLGLNQTSFRVDLIPNVEDFKKELNLASGYPDTFLNVLESKALYFKEFTGQQTITIKGLLSIPGNIEEIQNLLQKTVEFDQEIVSTVFQTIMKESEVGDIFESLDSLKRNIQEDEKSLEGAKQGLMDALGIVKKILKEEIQNIKDSSAKVEARMSRALKKKSDRLKTRLKRETAKLREAYRKQAKPLRGERTKRKRRVTRAEKRIERLRFTGTSEDIEAQKVALDELMVKYREMDEAVKALEAKRDGEVAEVRDRSTLELMVEEEKIKEVEKQAKDQIRERSQVGSRIEDEVKRITGQIDAMISKKRNRLRSLSRVKIDLDVEDIELYIPFYVFQYGEKRFDFHPPVVVAGSTGLLTRFRRMLTESQESKMGMLIRPQELFTDKYLTKVVKSLDKKTLPGLMYREKVKKLNLFRRREAMDLMMKGLLKMRRERWINDSEYIRLQEGLVDRLSTVSEP